MKVNIFKQPEHALNEQDIPASEAISALIALGYKAAEAEKLVKKISKPALSSEQLIREALKAAL